MSEQLRRLERAFVMADEAGNTEDAAVFAKEIRRLRAEEKKVQEARAKVPEGFTQYVPEPAKDPMSAGEYAQSYLESLARGATFGALDEIQGGVSGLMGMAFGRDFSEGYKEGVGKARARAEKFRKESPVVAYGSEIAGSLVPSLALAPLAGASRLGQAGLATAEGAAAGALSAEGGIEDRAFGGLVGGALGGTLGGASAALPKVTQEAKQLAKAGVELLPAQRMGGLAAKGERLIGSTIIGDIAGIPAATQESYQSFSKAFVKESLKDIGYELPKKADLKEVVADADKFVSRSFKEATQKAKFDADAVDAIETSILSKLYDADYLESVGLDKAAQDEFLSVVDDIALNKMKKGSLTGKELADVLSDIGKEASAKMRGDSTSRNIGSALFDVQSDILDAMPVTEASKNLQDARKAYRSMIAVKKAAKGKAEGAFTPIQAERALEAVYKNGSAATPQGLLTQAAKEVLPARTPPSGTGGDVLSGLKAAQLAGVATLAPATIPTAAAGMGAYRTGKLGREVGAGLLQLPRLPFEGLSKVPALSGLLAERLTEE